jgi:hypothetical protein
LRDSSRWQRRSGLYERAGLGAPVHLDAVEGGQLQAKLWCSLILLRQLVLREDTRALCQFFEREAPCKQPDLLRFIFSQIKDLGGIRSSPGQHQGTPVFHDLHIHLPQVGAGLGEPVDEMQNSRPVKVGNAGDEL